MPRMIDYAADVPESRGIPMNRLIMSSAFLIVFAVSVSVSICAAAQPPADAPAATYDPELAASLGADEYGMRSYVLVILTTGPNRVPDGPERTEMFQGHFANMNRLAEAGKLVLAGPLDGAQGRRGLFIMAVADIDEARALVATDPVIIKGEMAAEYHAYYGSAALPLLRDIHARIARQQP
jgi:uncharacterized protein YciI